MSVWVVLGVYDTLCLSNTDRLGKERSSAGSVKTSKTVKQIRKVRTAVTVFRFSHFFHFVSVADVWTIRAAAAHTDALCMRTKAMHLCFKLLTQNSSNSLLLHSRGF